MTASRREVILSWPIPRQRAELHESGDSARSLATSARFTGEFQSCAPMRPLHDHALLVHQEALGNTGGLVILLDLAVPILQDVEGEVQIVGELAEPPGGRPRPRSPPRS
jgi:hypothetical protein